MRTASTPRPEQALISPTQEAWISALQVVKTADVVGKKMISKTEIKHVHLNYLILQYFYN